MNLVSGVHLPQFEILTDSHFNRVAGGYAGGTNLQTLCNEINEAIINPIFIGFTNTNVGTEVKDFVCAAASAASKT